MKLAILPNGEPEIFYTIQGEGSNTGRPSVFIRLALCNLHCVWCDTPYTWNWHGSPWPTDGDTKYSKDKSTADYTASEILQRIKDYDCPNIVISGGEPLIQQAEIKTLLELFPKDWNVEIETNGTLIPSLLIDHNITYNVSPKLAHSGNSEKLSLRAQSLSWFSKNKKAVFKFVIKGEIDIAVVNTIAKDHAVAANRIILMPCGITSEEIRSESEHVIDLCLKYGFRFSDRLHVHIWGNTRAK